MPADNKSEQGVKLSPATMVIGLAGLLIAGIFGWLTFGPKPAPPPPPVLTEEAKDYLDHLALENVHMQAAESVANGRLIEILGAIRNNGNRKIKVIEVNCLFRNYGGQVVKRERVPVIGGATGAGSLEPGGRREFRLPFDDVPEGWDQQMPVLVIAQIQFE